ncbi:MAG: YifB family Mg chelatase-like AAA ATPase [Alcaligenaceae bacterium]
MALAVIMSRSLFGMDAPPVRVETHLSSGLPSFTMVGLADAEVRESRERVRAALLSSGYEFPAGRLTVNLSPADLPKESGRFDLPIALGVLLVSGQIELPELTLKDHSEPCVVALSSLVVAGELSLTGMLSPINGAIAIALAVARSQPQGCLLLPYANAQQASRVPGLQVLGAQNLTEVVEHLAGRKRLEYLTPSLMPGAQPAMPCLSDVRGQLMARRALEVAAAGGHSLLFSGTPGVGKTMLAKRLVGILPALTSAECLEVASVAAFAGVREHVWGQRPFRAPHHSASMAAMLGGGSTPRAGEVTLAHRGVLFLDEFPEFERRVREGLREPLESLSVTIARAKLKVDFPADFQLLAAMNPCPCGWYGHIKGRCKCRAEQITAYQQRLSGPVIDRIDLFVTLTLSDEHWLELAPGESSAVVRQRVEAVRQPQLQRQNTINARLADKDLERCCGMTQAAGKLLASTIKMHHLSARAIQRLRRVARTCADLSGEQQIDLPHLAEAFQYRPVFSAGLR